MAGEDPKKDAQRVEVEIPGFRFAGPLKLALILLAIALVVMVWWRYPEISGRFQAIPSSIALEITSTTLESQETIEVCSQPGRLSRNCHNKDDGEDGCPDSQVFEVTARTEYGRLSKPKIQHVAGDNGSYVWNSGAHFKRAKWEWIVKDAKLRFTTPISSKPVQIKVCSTEEVRKPVPSEPTVTESWESLANGSALSVRVPENGTGFLILKLPRGKEQRLPVGKSYGALQLVATTPVPNSHTEYSYVIDRSRGGNAQEIGSE